jgi:hypothetical protein
MLRDQRHLWTARGIVMTIIGLAILVAVVVSRLHLVRTAY